jgi:hypothetical protein
MIGNWRLVKFRKTYDTFECTECESLLIIHKYPSYCDCKLIHGSRIKNDSKKDHTFAEDPVEDTITHNPYDDLHLAIKGKTHTSVR